METPQQIPVPKKSCVISLMFPVIEDKEALDIKAAVDNAIKDIKEKRYTFQIVEV